MSLAGSQVAITAGSGTTVATQTVGAKEHQLFMPAHASGHILGTLPLYRLFMPAQAAGASKVYFDLFNATGSGKTLRILSCSPIVSGAVAVTGIVAVDLFLTRTTAVGTGGTATTAEGTSLTAGAICKMNPADASLPAGVTARAAPTGGATAGAVLSTCSLFTEETSAGSYVGNMNDLAARLRGLDCGGIYVPENSGIRVVQGSVASVGNIGFDLIFSAE